MAENRKQAYERGLHKGRVGGVTRALKAIKGARSKKQCTEALEELKEKLDKDYKVNFGQIDEESESPGQ